MQFWNRARIKWTKKMIRCNYYIRATTRIFFSSFIFFSRSLRFAFWLYCAIALRFASAWALLQYLLKWRLRKYIQTCTHTRTRTHVRVERWVALESPFLGMCVCMCLVPLRLYWRYHRWASDIYIRYACVYDAHIHTYTRSTNTNWLRIGLMLLCISLINALRTLMCVCVIVYVSHTEVRFQFRTTDGSTQKPLKLSTHFILHSWHRSSRQ